MEKVYLSPLVSICIPAHNADKYLSATLTALLTQDYPNLEIIIVNDHSTDDTEDIILNFNSPIIKYIATDRRGAAAARNEAFGHTSGDLIIFFDADDLIDRSFVSQQVEFWQSKSSKSLVLSRWGRFYEENANDFELEPEKTDKVLNLRSWVVTYWTSISQMTVPGRVLIPREILKIAGGWDERLSLNDDFEFYTRLIGFTDGVFINPNCALKYRSGINGLSQQKKNTEKQKAQFLSITLATQFVLERCQDANVKLACANILQAFIYESYPILPEVNKKVTNRIKELGGSNLEFPAGGFTKALQSLIGWRLTKKIKHLVGF